jgi:hypothetical protein
METLSVIGPQPGATETPIPPANPAARLLGLIVGGAGSQPAARP